jgi:glutathione S-transferase
MSALTLVIGNKNYSSWSLRPWFFMQQHNIGFMEKRVPLFTPATDAKLEQYGSDYKVPVLVDGDLIIWDSLAILEYLSEKYLGGTGWPGQEAARAIARSVSCEMHSSYANLRSELPMNCRKTFHGIELSPAAAREVGRIKSLWRRCRSEFGKAGEWLFGDFSIADAMFAPIALRFHGYGIPLEGIEKEYVQTVLTQPAILEWIEAGKAETEIIEEDEIGLPD